MADLGKVLLFWLCATLALWAGDVCAEHHEEGEAPPLVASTNGTIRGYRRSVESGETVDIYEGIPYGKLLGSIVTV